MSATTIFVLGIIAAGLLAGAGVFVGAARRSTDTISFDRRALKADREARRARNANRKPAVEVHEREEDIIEGRQLTVAVEEDGSVKLVDLDQQSSKTSASKISSASKELSGEAGLGCAILSPRGDSRWSEITEMLDQLNAAGSKQNTLAGALREYKSKMVTASAPLQSGLSLDSKIATLYSELPAIAACCPPEDQPDPGECNREFYAQISTTKDVDSKMMMKLFSLYLGQNRTT